MTQQPAAQPIDRRHRDRRELDGTGLTNQSGRSRRLSWVPQHTRELRKSIRIVSEPSHLLLGELRVGLARELSLAQRFALSRESSQWFAYHGTAASDDSLLVKLDQTLRGMGAAARASVASLKQSVDHWRLISAVDERSDAADLLRDALQHGADYEDLLLATVRVDSAVSHEMMTRRASIDSAESLEGAPRKKPRCVDWLGRSAARLPLARWES
jgi:hypothetical protein